MDTSNRVPVSIANLACSARAEGCAIRHPFGILNLKKYLKGERQYMALGGAAMLTWRGKAMLELDLGASSFELDEKTGFYDARFMANSEQVEKIFRLFFDGNWLFEHDPTLDIIAELTGSEEDHESIFTNEETKKMRVEYMRTVEQKQAEVDADTSTRASADMPTRRLFRIFELVMPNEMFEKMQRSSVVRFLSDQELATTDGGSKAGRTNDGFLIQNNLFLLR